MPGVVAFVILASSKFPTLAPLRRDVRWGEREPAMLEEFEFVELDGDGLPAFDFVMSRASEGAGTVMTGVDTSGAEPEPYINTDGATEGEEASVAYDGDLLIFTYEGA